LLAELADTPGDTAVWRGDCLAAVKVHGQVRVFEGAGPPGNGVHPEAPPSAPPIPAGPGGGRPQLPFGCKPAALARLFGSWGWDPGRARAALARLGVTMGEDALAQELALGRAGRGRLPKLGPAEVRALRQALARAAAEPALPCPRPRVQKRHAPVLITPGRVWAR
jgi:hypothetical protein